MLYQLPVAGQTVTVVLPQATPLPKGAEYRKYSEALGWYQFVEDEYNHLSSSQGEKGACPPPGSDLWSTGLTEGHWCVQLRLQDGGPNDIDGLVNFAITDPGVIAVLADGFSAVEAIEDTATTRMNKAVTVSVLANDTYQAGEAVTINSVNSGMGQVVINEDQTLTFTPVEGYIGQDWIVYSITGQNGGSDWAQVDIDIRQNQAPEAMPDSVSVLSGDKVHISVLANDNDLDGDTLTIVRAEAEVGHVMVNTDNTLTYQSLPNTQGIVTVRYTITDGISAVTAEVKVEVIAKRVEPVESKGGGSTPLALLFMLTLLCLNRRCIQASQTVNR